MFIDLLDNCNNCILPLVLQITLDISVGNGIQWLEGFARAQGFQFLCKLGQINTSRTK